MTADAHLRAWLGVFDADELAALLTIRHDASGGAPVRDLDELAERLVHPGSTSRVLTDLPTPALQVLETLAACGAGASMRRAAELLDASAAGGDTARHLQAVRHAVLELGGLALVWPTGPLAGVDDGARDHGDDLPIGTDDPLAVNPGVLGVLPAPWGLGRPVGAIVRDTPADVLRRILKAWGLDAPTRKADLVRAVQSHLADPRNVRIVLAGADAAHTEVVLNLARKAARGVPSHIAASIDVRDPSDDLADDLDDDATNEWDDSAVAAFDPRAYRTEQAALAWARDNGLAFAMYGGSSLWGLELPCEVVLALLPPGTTLPFTPAPPPVPSASVSPEHVHAAASGAVTETLAVTMAVVETVDRTPIAALKSGGVGARELARVAKVLGAQPTDVRLALELAACLNLLAPTREGRIGTSLRFSEWRRNEPAERAADLVLAWTDVDPAPTLDRGEDGKTIPALTAEPLGRTPLVRALILSHLRGRPGTGVTSADALADYVAWRLPFFAWSGLRAEVAAVWAEAHRLGVLAHGGLTDVGRAVTDMASLGELVAALGSMLPTTQRSALFGSDLTAVVPGSPAPAVVDLLDAVAEREARGSAATWRFTPRSVGRALDAGHDAEDVLARLQALTPGPLPQALEYLLRDVARRHGHVGVQGAGAVVVGEDVALLAEIAAHRSLRRVGLRAVAPTVLVAEAGPEEVLAALRAAGYLPVPLDANGVRVVPVAAASPQSGDEVSGADPTWAFEDADAALRRWAAESADAEVGSHSIAPPAALPGEGPEEIAVRLLRGDPPQTDPVVDRLAEEIGRLAGRLSGPEARTLAHAVHHHSQVQIRYRSSSGGVTVRVVSRLVLTGGYLHAWCHLRQDERWFALENVLSVAPV